MTILLFVLLPVLVVGAYATYTWLRNRQPTSVESGIDAFQREMRALSPEAAPDQRRAQPPVDEPRRPGPPRRPAGPERSDEAGS